MKIANANVLLNGSQQHSILSERSKATVLTGTTNGSNSRGVELTLSTSTREQQSLKTSSAVSDYQGGFKYQSNSVLASQLTESVLKMKVDVGSVYSRLASSAQGVMLEVQSVTQVESKERLTFEALGKVQTEDGRNIDFMLALDLQRSISAEQSSYFKGNVTLVDPLMINLNGGLVELSDQYFDFDLNVDGKTEKISQTAKGSGYLVFDKNGNGEIDDGSEMFGPQSGNGFAELAQYDEDGNGWIDENDSIFSKLSIMQFEDGKAVLTSAKDAGLGALYLGAIGANYSLLNKNGEQLGSIRNSGVGLSESGQALLLQEVHLRVEQPVNAKQPLVINNQTIAPAIAIQQLDVSAWVSNAMATMTVEEDPAKTLEQQYWSAFTLSSAKSNSSLFGGSEQEKNPLDKRIKMLNATIESIRQMRSQQGSFKHLNVYNKIGRMN